ncbi:PRC-barrel domain-containing protein [Roseomonas populi]|uniref:PRC-barrel domain-containing protein n=1 Tax=Roseomonas populi TaxID=3121582 RepID=UPI0027E34080|nr:PRC-barrel domain-containing protein [Roseomonas pecuniae]
MRAPPHRRALRLAFLLALAEAPAGMAQTSPPPAAAPALEAPQPQRPAAAREELPRQASQRIVGREVTGPSGDVVGRIVNVLLDDGGQPRAAVLDYGGFLGVGRRRVAVAWRTLRFSPEIVRLELTRDQMRAFPDYKEGEPVVVAAPPAEPGTAGTPAGTPAGAPGEAPNGGPNDLSGPDTPPPAATQPPTPGGAQPRSN